MKKKHFFTLDFSFIPSSSFFLLFSFLFFLSAFLTAQQYNFRTYSLEDGLAQSQIFSMCKDSRGNVWFGTNAGGISIFNGADFKNLTTRDGLVNNTIHVLFEDSKGNIWIGTDGGLSIHNGYDIKNYTVGMGISSSKILSIIEDKQGKIWLGTRTGGINIYKDGEFEIIITEDGLPGNNINALFQDNSGKIWASCFGYGIAVFNGKEISYFSTANGLLDDEVNCFYQDKQGTLWIGSEKGITIISDISNLENTEPDYRMTGHPVTSFYDDEQGNLWIGTRGGGVIKYSGKNYMNLTEANGLSNNHVLGVAGDNSGGVWVGTDGGGACHYSGDAFMSYTQTNGLGGNVVMAVQEDVFGKIWIGTFGNGLTRFDPVNNSFMTDFRMSGFNGKYVYAITEDISGNLWIGTHRDGLYKYDSYKFTRYSSGDGMPVSEIYCVFQDDKENIWIGGTGGVCIFSGNAFGSFGKEAGLNKDKVYSIAEDKERNLWFATEHGVVKKTDRKIITYSERDGLVSNFTASVISDKEGNIWIATEGGISYYDGHKFRNYTVKDGLTSGNIYSLVFDDDGNLIAGTEKGIDKISFFEDRKIQRVTNYSAKDGFKGIECNINAVHKDRQGSFWFGTVKGLTKYSPSREMNMEQLPQTHITDISLFFEKTDWKNFSDTLTRWFNLPGKLQLPYDKNHLTFQFAPSSGTGGSEKALFRFMLEGFDKAWSPLSVKREATYSNLPPGKYNFKVRTFFGEMESPPAGFSFSVNPPFWNTWWFYFLGVSVFITAGYVILTLRTRNLQRTKKRLEQMVRVRTEEILRQKNELENVSIVARETVQGVLIANKDGKVEWMNDGLQRMTGYSFDEIKVAFGEMLYQISSHPDIYSVLRTVTETKKSTQYDSMHRTKDGREQWVTGTVTPVFENGHLKKIVIIYSDITERKKFEQEINQKNKDITESILYAKQIQEAVLPQREKLFRTKPDSFIFYLPRDIVSGDFYWFSTRENILFIAAADCTGHGVPGALMSMIGNEFLYQITYQMEIQEPHLVLSELDKRIKQSLRQVGNEKEAKDGMDIAFCAINLENNIMKYAGAYRPLILLRNNGDFIEYEAEKVTIGGFLKTEKDFKSHTIQLQQGDIIYLFTDGYLDQFGGIKEKKFYMKGFKELLLKIYRLPMDEQKNILEKTFYIWKGDQKQTDDILVMGVKI